MPPKDDKKGKKPPPRPECIAPAEAQPPDEMSPEFYLNQIAELEVGVERYTELYKTLLEKSEELQIKLADEKEDSKAAFIQAKQNFEDIVNDIAKLEEDLKEMKAMIEVEKEEHDTLMKEKEKEYEQTEEELTANNQEILNQLNVIEEFKLNREELEEHIKSLEEEIRRREEVNQSQLEQQDREQVEGKNKLKKDILIHLAEVASEYRQKADANLPPTTKRLLMENYQLNSRVKDMYDEIKLLQQQSVEWKAEDERQINHMRSLEATNASITHRNITLTMVIDLMRDKIATLKELIEKYRPRDPTKRSSLADELMYIRGQLVESRDNLEASIEKKEQIENEVFEQRYNLAIQRAACVQLERALRDATWAVTRLLDRRIKGACADMDSAANQRNDVIVSLLMVLNKAGQHDVGPSLGSIVHPPQINVCKHLDYRPSERLADVGYEPGDLGIVPRLHSRLPTRRDGMRNLMAAQRRQAYMLISELSRKPTDPTTTSRVRMNFFSGFKRESMKSRAALAASRAKYLLSSKPAHTPVLPPINASAHTI